MRRLGLALSAAFALYLAGLDANQAIINANLGQQIALVQADIELQSAARDLLHDQIQYYQTDAYQERQARAKLGLQRLGEQVIIHEAQKTTQTPPADH